MYINFKKNILIIFFILSNLVLFSVTGEDLSSRITIDGYTDDFDSDEAILIDSLGNKLEYNTDSFWGENNDIRMIDVTWDSDYLYVGVDACSWDNNVILFLDIYDDYGLEDMSKLNTWVRSFKFYNLNPDFFLATWDTNNNPQFWKMRESESLTADELTIEDYATYDTGNLDRAMEAKIPWDIIYYGGEDGNRTMDNFPAIKFLAVITAGDDNTSGPDVAPDNLGGMVNNAGQMVVLDNYAEVSINEDNDGIADMNAEPYLRTSFYKKPPFESISLKIEKIEFPNGKVFNPQSGNISFELESNRASKFIVEIYSVDGKYINKAEETGDELIWEWDGRNSSGNFVSFGFYILRFMAESGEVSHKEAIAVVK